MRKRIGLLVCGGVLGIAAASASAHTVNICWRAESNGSVTMFAGSYHGESGLYGGIIIDGVRYDFTGVQPSLPGNISGCQPTACGSTPAVQRWQTVNVSGIQFGSHTVTTTSTSAYESPWPGCYPKTFEFGGGCDDDDGDGLCNDDDPCPQDPQNDADEDGVCGGVDVCAGTALPESVPTVRLGVNRFADTDGDGVFDTTSPHGVGPRRSYTIAETGGCSCEQIIAAQGLGNGHKKFGCSISAMDDWIAYLQANQLGPYRVSFYSDPGSGCSIGGGGAPPLGAGLLMAGAVWLSLRRRRARR